MNDWTVGIGGTALDWIRSFLSGRTQQVAYGGDQSFTTVVLFGVPQGTVLGPLLYVLYTAPLFNVIAQHRVDAHQYADDLQLYLCVPPAEASVAADRLDACLAHSKPGLTAAGSDLTRAKLRSCGLDLHSSWPKCGLTKFQCCHLRSGSSMPRGTSAL